MFWILNDRSIQLFLTCENSAVEIERIKVYENIFAPAIL